jgi:hypothetical protein
LLGLVEAALDDVAASVPLPLLVTEVDRATRRLRRWALWSSRSGIVVAMPRSHSHARFALDG